MIEGLRDSRWLSRAQIDDADWNARVAVSCGGSAGYMHTAYLDAVAPGWGALLFADGALFPIWPRGWGPLRQCRQPWFVQHLAVLPPSGTPSPSISPPPPSSPPASPSLSPSPPASPSLSAPPPSSPPPSPSLSAPLSPSPPPSPSLSAPLSPSPPVSSGHHRSSARELAERLTHARLAVLKGASLLEFQVDEPPPLADQVPAGWQAIGRTTYRLPIDSADSQATRAGYSGHHRRLIRPMDGLHYGKTNNPDPFLRLFVAQVAGKAGLTAEQIRSLGRLLKSLLHNQHADLWTLMREQELLCGCVLLRSGDRLVYQLASSSGASMQMGGMHRLVDHILHRPEYRGLTLDFEGSDLTGLQRFYSGFGARPHTYTRWLLDKRHPILKRVQRI